jgi:hypothetical protein
VYLGASPTIRSNISPPSSVLKSKPSKKAFEAGSKLLFKKITVLQYVGPCSLEDI